MFSTCLAAIQLGVGISQSALTRASSSRKQESRLISLSACSLVRPDASIAFDLSQFAERKSRKKRRSLRLRRLKMSRSIVAGFPSSSNLSGTMAVLPRMWIRRALSLTTFSREAFVSKRSEGLASAGIPPGRKKSRDNGSFSSRRHCYITSIVYFCKLWLEFGRCFFGGFSCLLTHFPSRLNKMTIAESESSISPLSSSITRERVLDLFHIFIRHSRMAGNVKTHLAQIHSDRVIVGNKSTKTGLPHNRHQVPRLDPVLL